MRSQLVLFFVAACGDTADVLCRRECIKGLLVLLFARMNGRCQCATGGPNYFHEDSKCTEQMTADSDKVPLLEESHLYLHCVGTNADIPQRTGPGMSKSMFLGVINKHPCRWECDRISGQDALLVWRSLMTRNRLI
jgi:hypothetical protein